MKKRIGICALTGLQGKFVKSHIIPQALTRLNNNGERVIEAGLDIFPGWRSTSWYDDELVTQAGEDILKDIDDRGIKLLKEKCLIWLGWGEGQMVFPNDENVSYIMEGLALRKLNLTKSEIDTLRLFYLSILWRAVASKRREMKNVKMMQAEAIEDLRIKIKSQDAGECYYYPISLDQMLDRGSIHNRSPIYETTKLDDETTLGYFRFYFSGLVCSMYNTTDKVLSAKLSKFVLGQEHESMIYMRQFESSKEYAETLEIVIDVNRKREMKKNKKI